MRIRLQQKRNVQGSVLLATIGITFILGLGVASYLSLVRWQHVAVIRSQAWNAAMGMAEAGVEEALAQLNPAAMLSATNINRGANGWTLGADGMYHAPRRIMPHGYYDVALSADTYPIICATGYVTIPTLSATVHRAVRASTGVAPLFLGAMAARVNIDFKGNGVETDSFISTDPNYSTDGLYDPAKRRDHGDVACTEGIINVQNAQVLGSIATGPSGGYTDGSGNGTSGSVGDFGWVLGGNVGVQPGHYDNDFNMDFPDVLPPFQTGLIPSGDTIDGTNYTWILGYGNYMVDNPKWPTKFNTGDKILVTGRARLYVTGDFIMGGGSELIIAPGASIELFVGGANCNVSTVNSPGNCATFAYYGLPGNTSIDLSGNNELLGTFYAPNADLKLSGSGSGAPVDFQGCCVVRTIQMNGHFRFHFDENLKRKGPNRGFQLASWQEI